MVKNITLENKFKNCNFKLLNVLKINNYVIFKYIVQHTANKLFNYDRYNLIYYKYCL